MTRWGHEVGGGRAYQHEEEATFRSRGEVARELFWVIGDVGDITLFKSITMLWVSDNLIFVANKPCVSK